MKLTRDLDPTGDRRERGGEGEAGAGGDGAGVAA